MKQKLLLLIAAFGLAAATGRAQDVIFDLADTSDVLFSHTTSSPLAPQPGNSGSLGNGTFSWDTLATDTTANTAEFSSGLFSSSDWGGEGTFTSVALDVTSYTSFDIDVQWDGLFNTGSEFANFYYQLDAGPVETFAISLEDVTYTDEIGGVSGVSTAGASTLTVGFTYNHNGSSDFFNVDSMTVTAIPEPSTFILVAITGLAAFGVFRRKK